MDQSALGEAPQASSAPLLLFENVSVFDGEKLLPPTDVVVEQDRITAVGDEAVAPEGAEVVDGADMTLLPGLIDAHVHTFAATMLMQALVFGVTTVFDMFTSEEFAAQMRQEQAAGAAIYRADLLSSGTLATAPGGHGTQFGLDIDTLTEPAQAEKWVADRVAAGADYVKVIIESGEELGTEIPTLDEATVAAVVKAAHAQGLIAVAEVDLLQDDRIAPYLSPMDVQSIDNPATGVLALSYANGREGLRLLHEAGVPILAGTDAPNPGTAFGASIHAELELLVNAGLTPSEALAAATSVNAKVFGLGDRGRIAPGLVADLLLVEGDPTQDITATRNIVAIYKRGVPADRVAYRAALESSVEQARAQALQLEGDGPLLVSDFESGENSVRFGNPWVPTSDAEAGGNSEAVIEVVDGGADDSAYSLQVTGTLGEEFPFPWSGTMFLPGAQPFGPADLSSRPQLTFWAKGDEGNYRVQLICQNSGQVPPEYSFELTDEWIQIGIDLGTVGGCDTAGIMAVIFSAMEPGEFQFQLDDVELSAE